MVELAFAVERKHSMPKTHPTKGARKLNGNKDPGERCRSKWFS
jgi:hypothetical protein